MIRSTRQIGIYAADRPPLGRVDDNDLVITALFSAPRLDTLWATLSGPISVLRWNEIRTLQLDLRDLGFYRGEIEGRTNSDTLLAAAAFRDKAGLPSLPRERLEALLKRRGGVWEIAPAARQFDYVLHHIDDIAADPAALHALQERLLQACAQQAFPMGIDEGILLPPRAGMTPQTWRRNEENTFRFNEDLTPARFDKGGRDIVQSFLIADADRDGRIDALGMPVEVLAAGAGVIVGIEKNWSPKGAPRTVRQWGNRVWLYLPQRELLIAYLGMEDVRVSLGQSVKAGYVLGTAGRTGLYNHRRRRPTALHAAAFKNANGRLVPIDVATLWGKNLPAIRPPRLPGENSAPRAAGLPVKLPDRDNDGAAPR